MAVAVGGTGESKFLRQAYSGRCLYQLVRLLQKDGQRSVSSPVVAPYLAENFVCVRINAEDGGEGQAFAQKQGITAFPTSVFLDSQGRILSQLVGFKPAEAFLKKLHQVQTMKAHK